MKMDKSKRKRSGGNKSNSQPLPTTKKSKTTGENISFPNVFESKGTQLRNGKFLSANSRIGSNNNAISDTQFVGSRAVTDNNPTSADSDEEVEHIDEIITQVDSRQVIREFPEDGELDDYSDSEPSESYNEDSGSEVTGMNMGSEKEISFNCRSWNKNVNLINDSMDSVLDHAFSGTFDNLKGDPAFDKYIKSLVAAELQSERKKSEKSGGKTLAATPKMLKAAKGTPSKGKEIENRIKSPSDTTLYAPALRRNSNQHTEGLVNAILHGNQGISQCTGVQSNVATMDNNNNLTQAQLNQISQFIAGVRLDGQDKSAGPSREPPKLGEPSTSADCVPLVPAAEFVDPDVEDAQRKADKIILDAEKFKATVNAPPGEPNLPILHDLPNFGFRQVGSNNHLEGVAGPSMVLEDDDFFHVTCHVDKVFKGKD